MNNEAAANSQACASCKHQGKKCDENCELAPYFPATRYLEFQNAQHLFGVSNIQRIIASVDIEQRQAAANSILMEGKMRCNNPVHGALGIVRKLDFQIELCKKQLEIVKKYLVIFRENQKENQKLESFKSESPVLPPLPPQILQHEDHFDGLYRGLPSLPDLSMNDMKSYEQEATYLKPLDIQALHEMMKSYDQHETVHKPSFETGESSTMNKVQGKQPMEFIEENETKIEVGSTSGVKMEQNDER